MYPGGAGPQGNRKKGETGCIVLVVGLLLLGLALGAAGFVFGDLVGYDMRTGQYGTIRTTLYIIGGVFGAIGAFGLFVLIAGRDRDDG